MTLMLRQRQTTGFTLVELLVSIAIIGVLVALLLPAVQAAREAARGSQCKNNLKQLGLALHHYHDSMGRMPSGWAADQPEGTPGWGWTVDLLPYLEQQNLVDGLIRRQLPIADSANQQARETVLPFLLCPSDGAQKLFQIGDEAGASGGPNVDDGAPLFKLARSNYVGVFGVSEIEDAPAAGEGAFYFQSRVRFADMTDGLSNTLVVGERYAKYGGSLWVGVIEGASEPMPRVVGVGDHVPNDPHHHFDDFASYHPGGVHFLYGDGSVRRIDNTIQQQVYQALITIAAGEAVSAQ